MILPLLIETTERAQNPETGQNFKEFPIPELPESVVQPIREKNALILEKFKQDKREIPQVVIILERSAVLPSLSITKKITESFPNTTILRVPIGKVLPVMFAEAKMLEDDEFDEDDLDLNNPTQAAEFIVWLKNTSDPTIQKLLQELTQLQLRNKNILVLDDAVSSGETIKLTLPSLLRAVYTRTIDFESEAFFSANFSWEKTIVESFGLDLTTAEKKLIATLIKGTIDIRRFKIELESGFYDIPTGEQEQIETFINDNYEAGNVIVELDSDLSIKIAGYQALFKTNALGTEKETQNPADRLLSEFGIHNLTKITKEISEKFLNI